jgi:hypothetical protein
LAETLMIKARKLAGLLLGTLVLAQVSAVSAQGTTPEQMKDLILDAVALELADDLCENIDIPGDELVEIGEAKHYLRGKVGLSKVELAAARGAMEGEAKKNKAAYCAGAKKSQQATYKKLLAAVD